MKIYRCNTYDPHEGHCVSWHPNFMSADLELRRTQRERGEPALGTESVELVEVPTTKAELIEWLNMYFNRDNG